LLLALEFRGVACDAAERLCRLLRGGRLNPVRGSAAATLLLALEFRGVACDAAERPCRLLRAAV
jgi:hypothetical protein